MLKCNYRCRKANLDDDVGKIAKYIHLTDPYIYPKIAKEPEDKTWVGFISACMKEQNNLFCVDNISVVVCGGDIVGTVCVIPCQRELTITKNIDLPGELASRIRPVIDGYFDLLIEESRSYTGYNITNICIDESHRGKGAGYLLMSHCIAEYGAQTIHLDVIASNKVAVELYKSFGFRTTEEYIGFSGDDTVLPCYHMVRHAQ